MSSLGQEFSIRPAESFADYMFLRRLRNAVRNQMTNDVERIGILKQFRFFFRRPRNMRMYLACMGEKRVGYLLLRFDGSTCLITEAVDPRYRRMGVAGKLIDFARGHHRELTAEILLSNAASIELHRSCGFSFICDDGRKATYRFKN